MKFKFVFLVLLIFLSLSFVIAQEICIDFDDPSVPPSLAVTSSGTNIILTWDAATDEPSCSGIDYYNISRDGEWIGTVSSDTLTYTDENVPYGTYDYTVYAVDKVVHNSGDAIKNNVDLSEPTNGGGDDTTVSRGGGSSSSRCKENWRCGDWGECENGLQTRTCEDANKCGTKKSKPDVQKVCDIEEGAGEETETITVEEPGFFSRITGAVIGGGSARIIIPIIFIILIIWAVITVYIKRKMTEKEITSSEDVEEVVEGEGEGE